MDPKNIGGEALEQAPLLSDTRMEHLCADYIAELKMGSMAQNSHRIAAFYNGATEVRSIYEAALSKDREELSKLRAHAEELWGILNVAKCPDCDGQGTVVYAGGDIGPCLWCDQRREFLALYRADFPLEAGPSTPEK